MARRSYDFIVVGAGSAGCAVAEGLASAQSGRILVLEAGPSDRVPWVRMPFGLVWMMGSKRRDWRYQSAPQQGLNGRVLGIPRGRMLGGSGSINSMVWFRGRRADFDNWSVPGWTWSDVEPAFEEVESRLQPRRLSGAHPLTEALSGLFAGNDLQSLPNPEREGAGVFEYNLHRGRRWSPADAFLRPALARDVQVMTGYQVAKIGLTGDRASFVVLNDGTRIDAAKGVILSAGSIGSPEILLKSGVGPADDLRAAGVTAVHPLEGVGANLHDHPTAGIHYEGAGSGYGPVPRLAHRWAAAPFQWLLAGRGIFASPTVEGGGFFNAAGNGGEPDVQSHFIPFRLPHDGRRYARRQGYFADVCVCRPKSRGALRLTRQGLSIDLGIFNDETDLDLLTTGYMRLRSLMAEADLGPHQAPEVAPGASVANFEQARAHIRANAATAYHPVGTMRMGVDADAPVTARLKVRGLERLWVADASVMPAVTSANTNAPSMMIGHRAAAMIAADCAV